MKLSDAQRSARQRVVDAMDALDTLINHDALSASLTESEYELVLARRGNELSRAAAAYHSALVPVRTRST